MPRWTAKCWMGSNSGYVDIEVSANTINGAKEQLQNIYGAEQIINLRRVSDSSGSFGGSLGNAWGVGLIALVVLFVMFMPWVMMTVYGAGATWVGEKITGQSVQEYIDEETPTDTQSQKALITFCLALIVGGIGFVQGTSWNKQLNTDSTNQPRVEQIKKQ